MKQIIAKSYLLLAAASSLLFSACQQQQQNKPYPVFFLTETRGNEEGSNFMSTYKGRHYQRMPFLSLKHFGKFASFINPDGSYGVVLEAKKEYVNRVLNTTLEYRGMRMLPVVNGLAFEEQLIAPVSDGKLVIWNGLNGYDLYRISRTVTPCKPALEEARYKKKDPRPRPKVDPKKKKNREPQSAR